MNSPLQLETAPGRLICRWPAELRQGLNLADEDLCLRLMDPFDLSLLQQHKVNLLSARQLSLQAGRYRVELARVPRPEVSLRTSLEPTPQLTWIQDSPGSAMLIWSELDWPDIQQEVVRLHGVDWATGARVAMRVVRPGPKAEWIEVPERDHLTLEGLVEQVELCVVEPETNKILRTLFSARRLPADPLQVLAAGECEVPGPSHNLRLVREIVETDTLQVRAVWTAPETFADGELRLILEKDGREVQADPGRKVNRDADWYFHGLEPGTYVAKLLKPRRKAPVLESSPLVLPEAGNRIALMPVDYECAFAYWHVALRTWQELAERHGDLLGRVHCRLKVYHEYAGEWWLQEHLSVDVNLNTTRDYYLKLPPDRLYRVEVVAIIDGDKEEALTGMSAPCQLGRLGPGTNPIAQKWQPQKLEHPTIRPLDGPRQTSRYSIGYMLLHLHAHLPFIADPVDFHGGEKWRPMGYPQEWYPEAVRETYLPLLQLFETLLAEEVDFKLSMDLSPTVVAMMKSQRHAADALEYLERLIVLARLEVERTAREEPHFHRAAQMHLHHLTRSRDLFVNCSGDLAAAFKRFQELGKLELCTCVGTHPMLPLWMTEPQAIRGQCLAAAEYHREVFGRPSLGVWLPECAYTPGVEPFLEEAGFRYFFSEATTVQRGDAPAEFGVNAPVYIKGSSVAVFPRDPETGNQVWSGEDGYPGDVDYLEFHIRGGPFKYNRITDRKGGWKQPYNPDWADRKAASHAGHFVFCRNSRFEYLRKVMWKKPIVIAPYDAELFGHHWYEGPRFLYYMFKKLHFDQNQTELITPSGYLTANPTSQDLYPTVSSWGARGTFEKWMFGDVSWMYRHGHEAAAEMGKMAASGPQHPELRRVLAQAGRQLMLAMSSDLPFVISNGHFVDRMKEQFFTALRHFWHLSAMFWRVRDGGEPDLGVVRALEIENPIFPDLDPDWFAHRL